eukprot:TRINITY_DN17214_c0_g1_i2.p1 TRINITY_DN17214_c0_g1~~TRINITY_DN17214_c0_g1_i2.p1  ORF type:complete len:140 (-),score=42.63 TRINITY_DN17214_c0_g1_i2:355-774(-)
MGFFFFFFKQKTAYEMLRSLVGSEMCIRDSRRFKLQNFYDGQKQDCISLVTGHHVPSPSRDPDQSTLHRPEVPNTIIKCSLLCVTALFLMLVFDHLIMNRGAFTTEICFGYASFMVMVGVMARTAITRRKALVVNPLLR